MWLGRFPQQSRRDSRMAVIIRHKNNWSRVAWWLTECFRWGSWWWKMETICLLKAGFQLRGFSNPEFCELTQRNGDLKVRQFRAHLRDMQSDQRNTHFTLHYLTEYIKEDLRKKEEAVEEGAAQTEKQKLKRNKLWKCVYDRGGIQPSRRKSVCVCFLRVQSWWLGVLPKIEGQLCVSVNILLPLHKLKFISA